MRSASQRLWQWKALDFWNSGLGHIKYPSVQEQKAQSNDSEQCSDSEFERVGMGTYTILTELTPKLSSHLMDGKGCSLPSFDEWLWHHHICLRTGSSSQVSDNEGLPNKEVKCSTDFTEGHCFCPPISHTVYSQRRILLASDRQQ